ncbi:hypothetical protein [Clostridium uliginosum]|uniref:Uncharacterized protein n=1 Tax=Clostridium uliginosum TaxID=119641 RepID=A0A1I1HF28_9CLOT|nr:hypothetical protein [Clostridium uliginosum]SFC22441.1 hypothetical protein SAMN05421842_101284 [Clostridium uliginosum]
MKKSTVIVILGVFIVGTSLLCISSDNIYKKQKKFNSSSEVLQQLDNNVIIALDEKGVFSETNELKECLSKRKRISNSQINYLDFNLKEVKELNEKQKKSILDDYIIKSNSLVKSNKKTIMEPVRVLANVKYDGGYRHSKHGDKEGNIIFDFVIVDEGEGFVIDYIVEHNPSNAEEGETNVEG